MKTPKIVQPPILNLTEEERDFGVDPMLYRDCEAADLSGELDHMVDQILDQLLVQAGMVD
jgi:hypothetical protein